MSEQTNEMCELVALAEALELENREILNKYPIYKLEAIFNGIGSDQFPEALRNAISNLNPTLQVVALIHDVEWHESDKSKTKFAESNERFKRNGYKAAKAKYGACNPLRYYVMNKARVFGNLCHLGGWNAWESDCECGVCTGEVV